VTKQPARLSLAQHPVAAKGSATIGNRTVVLDEVKITGEAVRFSIPGLGAGGKPLVLEGRAQGDVMEGTVPARGGPAPWRATRAGG
jgi:hypothetical protein